jgi:predicted DNA-binding transcriptional regulator YafY
MVRIRHISGEQGELEETEFAPYFIGFSEQANGRRPISVTGRLRHTTKVETIDITNIKDAEIIDQTYTIPDNLKAFDPNQSSVRMESRDLIPLKIKISERSVLNVFHYLYYKNMKVEEEKDGGLVCRVDVENSIELFLRLVQCGTAVEVLEPTSYRSYFSKEIASISRLYHTAGD